MPELTGYKGNALSLLSKHSVAVGDTVSVKTDADEYAGILMPRYEFADEHHIVIKLKSGYNIGIETGRIRSLARIESKIEQQRGEKIHSTVDEALPKISLISTGGTIASKIDYRTGGVKAALTAEELYNAVPELSRYASIDTEVLFSEYSENLTPKHWSGMARKVHEKISGGYEAVILTHGTDTMHYTAAALSFALRNIPVPVVLVGAQRSSDRPSSDAATNLIGAALFASKADVAGVFVCMHSSIADGVSAVHLGTRTRKNHASRRDAFESIDVQPAAYVTQDSVEMRIESLPKRRKPGNFDLKPEFDEKVALLKYHPGMNPALIDHLADSGYKAIVLEGTGLGHVGKQCFDALRNVISRGMLVCMCSQCIWGRVQMTVYETGRDLLGIGVVPLSDMIAETALVKAMWAVANSKNIDDAKQLLMQNIANEFSDTSPIDEPAKS